MKNVNIRSELKVNVFLIVTDNLLYSLGKQRNKIHTLKLLDIALLRSLAIHSFQHDFRKLHSYTNRMLKKGMCVFETIESITGSLFNSHVAKTCNFMY